MNKNKDLTIKCPHCDYEYLPGEIYFPDQFLGQPKDIERTIDGKIAIYDGIEQNLTELYYCEKCNKPFKVKANINFETEKAIEWDLDEEYSSPLYKDRISLAE